MTKFAQRYIAPLLVPVGVLAVIVTLIVTIGTIFINLHVKENGKDTLNRPEIWFGSALLLGVIALMAFLTMGRENAKDALAKPVLIGGQPFWDVANDVPAEDPRQVFGQPGYLEDIQPGFDLYAQSGKLARVIDVLPGGRDYGREFKGFLHAEGVGFAAREMWIPIEAVSAVYPEKAAAFLAIKGDETEAFGWTAPPEAMTRGERKHVSASDKVK